MTPFLQFRLWLRRAPAGERLVAASLALVVVIVAAWSLVSVGSPNSDHGGSLASVGQQGSHAGHRRTSSSASRNPSTTRRGSGGSSSTSGVGSTGSGGSNGSGGPVGSSASTSPSSSNRSSSGHRRGSTTRAGHSTSSSTTSSSEPAAPSCGPRTSTDQGVTAKQIHIDIDVADLAGQAGNSLVGLPSAPTEEKMFAAAINAVNASGGVRCRTLVAKYYVANPLLTPSLQSVCLNMVADKPFAILDEGLGSPVGSPTPRDCPPAHQVPEFGSLSLSQGELNEYAPYLFGDYPPAEETVNDSILGAHELGWFKGAKKIGLLEQDCTPDLNRIALADLAKIGYPTSKVATFDFGCPNDIPPASSVENAVLRFKSAGVTNVLDDGGVYENYFANDAHQQDYKPRYSVGDQGTIALWDNRAFGPNPENFSDALAITGTQYGAENTPGMRFNSQTAKCNRAMNAHHLPGPTQSPDGFAGVACTLVTMFVAAADYAPKLQRNELAAGLDSLGHLALPFPGGPANLAASHGQAGGGYWRADRWNTGCACFRVWKPQWRPSFS